MYKHVRTNNNKQYRVDTFFIINCYCVHDDESKFTCMKNKKKTLRILRFF